MDDDMFDMMRALFGDSGIDRMNEAMKAEIRKTGDKRQIARLDQFEATGEKDIEWVLARSKDAAYLFKEAITSETMPLSDYKSSILIPIVSTLMGYGLPQTPEEAAKQHALLQLVFMLGVYAERDGWLLPEEGKDDESADRK